MRTISWCIVALAAFVAVSRVAAAETVITPALALGEEYTDNLFLDPDRKVADYIYHVVPSLAASYAEPFWEWNAAYSYDARFYAKTRYDDPDKQKLALISTMRLVPDRLFIRVRGDADRTSISSVRDYSQDSPVKNQTDYTAFEVSPYAAAILTSRATLTVGYRYRKISYEDPAAVDHTAKTVYGDFARSVSARTSLTALLNRDRIETAVNGRTRVSALVGARYEYRERSSVWGMAGSSRTTYADGLTETHPVWNAGVIRRMATVSLSCETARTWVDDPYLTEQRADSYRAEVKREGKRATTGISLAHQAYRSELSGEESKDAVSGDLAYALTGRLHMRYTLNLERYELHPSADAVARTRVRRSGVLFDYLSTGDLTFQLSYRQTDSDSPDTHSDNYKVNLVYLGATMKF